MPRDTDGTYTLPLPPVVSGTTISSSWANVTMDDIATTLTQSLDRQGRGGMLAPFQFDDGTQSLPGATWAAEPTTGFYRAGLGDLRTTILGQDLLRWNGTAVPPVVQVWADGIWNNLLYGGSTGTLPDGTDNWQSLSWDNNQNEWTATSALTINTQSGNVDATTFVENGTQLASKYLGITAKAADSSLLNGDNAAFYQNSDNQNAGTLDTARLSGTYSISITGSAGSAGNADNANLLGNQGPSFYQNSGNQNAGILPSARLTGSYTIDIIGNASTATNATNASEAANSDTVDGWNVAVVASLPGTPDPNTLYFVTA